MEPLTRVVDVAFVRYRTTDLAAMERFLLDFGMQVAHRTESRLYRIR